MTLILAPVAGEAEFADPALVGAFADELPKMLNALRQAPWCSYAVREDGRLVGMGGFKGPPTDENVVEIGYLTFVPEAGRGIATLTTAQLVRIAAAAGLDRVRAHTLPEISASTRVLEANGFRQVSLVQDPEDGMVWRWERG